MSTDSPVESVGYELVPVDDQRTPEAYEAHPKAVPVPEAPESFPEKEAGTPGFRSRTKAGLDVRSSVRAQERFPRTMLGAATR